MTGDDYPDAGPVPKALFALGLGATAIGAALSDVRRRDDREEPDETPALESSA